MCLTKKLFNSFISYLLAFLVCISLIGAVYYFIQDLSIKSLLVLFTFLLGCGLLFIVLKKLNRINVRIIYLLILLLTLLIQITLSLSLAGRTYWDPFGIIHTAMGGPLGVYFSYNPNTIGLLGLEKLIYFITLKPTVVQFVKYLNIFNIILLDLSCLFLYLGYKKAFNKYYSALLLFLTWVLMLISPYCAIFYSDIPAFFISSLIFYLCCLGNTYHIRILISIILGLGYFIKPSLTIILIALCINILCYENPSKWIKTFVCLLVPFLLISISGNRIIKEQVDYSKAITSTHFIAMGLAGNGGFNAADVYADRAISSPKKRKQHDINLIKKRLTQYGVKGYLKFLFYKQMYNTSDATFGWKYDGGDIGFLIPFRQTSNLTNFIRYLYISSSSGKNWHKLAIIQQTIWIITLIGILFTVQKHERQIELFKLIILGFLAFLLIFEGGRSRYVIQFLPFIIVIASIGLSRLCNYIRYNTHIYSLQHV